MSFLHHLRHPRTIRWLAPALLVLYGMGLLLCCVEHEWRQEWDSAIYLVTARSMANDQGYTYLGKPFFLRPPALSWLLSHFAGGEQFDFTRINFMLMVAAVLSIFAVYLFARFSFSRGWALLISLLTGTSPLFFSRFNWILSEFFFLLFFFPALGLLEWGAREGRHRTPALVGGAVLLAAATYFRTLGIIALPAVLVVVFVRRTGGKRFLAILPVLLVVLLVLPWFLHAHHAESLADRPAEQFLLFSYGTALFNLDPGDPDSERLTFAHWVGRMKRNSEKLVRGMTLAVLGTEHGLAATVLVIVVLAGFVVAVARGPSIIDLFFLVYGILLLLYFAYQARLLMPLVPLVYAYLVRMVLVALRRTSTGSPTGRAVAVSAALFFLLLSGLNVRGLVFPPVIAGGGSGPGSAQSAVLPPDHVLVADWLKANTPEDARVVARMAPIISVLADREVYTYLYTRKENLLQRLKIEYVVSFGETPDFLDRQVREWIDQRWFLPATAPDQVITIYRLKTWESS